MFLVTAEDVEPARTGPLKRDHDRAEAIFTLRRLALFLCLVAALTWSIDAAITAGLRRLPSGIYGITNRMLTGRINADILVTGSSRAVSHYDPRIIQQVTGLETVNLGRNGSQTDMQLAVLKGYLKHNKPPQLVVHNLDAFSLQTSHDVYSPAQYVPYLSEDQIYGPLKKINPEIWKSRYIPLYGYVVDDMSYAWVLGLKAWLPFGAGDELVDGFRPRQAEWTGEFAAFRAAHPQGVSWEIETVGVPLMEELIRTCQGRGIRLILVYSPEYRGMQALTTNRRGIFESFHALSSSYGVPLWDYSDWRYAADTRYFINSQHMNADGARQFSSEFALKLRDYLRKPDDLRRITDSGRSRSDQLPH